MMRVLPTPVQTNQCSNIRRQPVSLSTSGPRDLATIQVMSKYRRLASEVFRKSGRGQLFCGS